MTLVHSTENDEIQLHTSTNLVSLNERTLAFIIPLIIAIRSSKRPFNECITTQFLKANIDLNVITSEESALLYIDKYGSKFETTSLQHKHLLARILQTSVEGIRVVGDM